MRSSPGKAAHAVVEVHDIVAYLDLAQLLERQGEFARAGAVALEGVFVEAVENLMVGEDADFGLMVYKAFMKCALYGLEVDFVATVGKDFAQSVELPGVVGEYEQPVALALEARERVGNQVEILVIYALGRTVEVNHRRAAFFLCRHLVVAWLGGSETYADERR